MAVQGKPEPSLRPPRRWLSVGHPHTERTCGVYVCVCPGVLLRAPLAPLVERAAW
jgi:hypothetical protein